MPLWFLSQLKSVIHALHAKDNPRQLAMGFAIGSLIGWVPFNILYSPIIFIILYSLNVNLGFGVLGIGITTLFSFLLDPWAGRVGHYLLTQIPALHPVWTTFFNIPIVPFTRFNNTVMLGSIVLAILLATPLYFLSYWLIQKYRATWYHRVEKWRLVRWFKASKPLAIWLHLKGQ